jgi:hypothetical protein
LKVTSPNQYHLQGGGISVAYYPDGSGPIPEGRGPLHLVYQDASRSLAFYGEEVRTIEAPDLGTVVSVTIVETEDTGYTSFSLPVPDVDLPTDQSSVFVHTEGITTVHRIFAALIAHPQSKTYTVTPLNGTAAAGPLPL